MSNTIRIKRRAAGGSAGAPASLQNAELAFNEVDDVLYYGKGTGGAGGTATTVEAIGGKGAFVGLTGDQSVAGAKTFTGTVVVPTPSADTHAATKAYVDSAAPNLAAGSGIAITGTTTKTIAADSTVARLASPAFTGTPTAPTPVTSDNTTKLATTAYVKAQGYLTSAPVTSVAGKTGVVTLVVGDVSGAAPLASPALTGTPTAPTPANGTNSTQLATTAFVQAALSALIDSAPGTLDTLNELAAALGDDPNFAATVTTSLASKLTASSNLSDLTNVATARNNLGLGTMATQAANNVAITGGTIAGITIDGGTF